MAKRRVRCASRSSAKVSKSSNVREGDLKLNSLNMLTTGNIFNLPHELKLHIFSFLTHEELCRSVAPVCQEWWKLSKEPPLWKSLEILVRRLDEKEKCVRLLKRHSRKLTTLKIKTSFSLQEFACIACPMLKHLDLNGLKLDNEDLAMFVKNCPLVEDLNMEYCCVEEKCVLVIARLKHLRVLNLSWCSVDDDDCITSISEKCTQLEDVNIYCASGVLTVEAICKFLENLNSTLRRLLLGYNGFEWTDLIFEKIGLCTKLQHLTAGGRSSEQLTDQIFVYLKMLTGLQSLALGLTNNPLLTTAAVNNFFSGSHVNALVTLNLRYIDIDDDGVYNITQNCKLLKSLSLASCSAITEVGFKHIVKHCSNLTYLDLSNLHHLTGFCLRFIPKKLSHLRFLNLYQCRGIFASFVKDLAVRMPKLTIELEYGSDFCEYKGPTQGIMYARLPRN